MAVRGVACDEQAVAAITVRQSDAQIPEADMFECDIERLADGRLQERTKIKIVFRGPDRNGRMEKPGRAKIDPTEELPVSFQIGM